MEPVTAGVLSLIPPMVAVMLALKTREVYSSLLAGIFSGALIYSIMSGSEPVVRPFEVSLEIMSSKFDLKIVVFCALLGALIYVINASGGIRAYGEWARKRIRTRRKALFSTMILGFIIFIDDYFNCLTVGTVMKPVTDSQRISREKLAYIIDSTAAPICIIAPISSWAVAVSSNLSVASPDVSPFAIFISCIPWNFYAIFCLCFVFIIVAMDFDFGPMRRAELRARTAPPEQTVEEESKAGAGGKRPADRRDALIDMLAPLFCLICVTFLAMLYSGGYWGREERSISEAMGNTDSSLSLILGALAGLICAFVLYLLEKRSTLAEFMNNAVKGAQNMMPAVIILMLAWTLSGITRDLLDAPKFIGSLISADNSFAADLLPASVFLLAGFLSFSIGTAWGTFGILIPIVVSVLTALFPGNSDYLCIVLSAVLAGAVFGDHCSPISDTTVLSSAGAQCEHINHVSTQMPYSIFIAGVSISGYVVAGLTANLWMSLAAAAAVMVTGLYTARILTVRAEHSAAAVKQTVSGS